MSIHYEIFQIEHNEKSRGRIFAELSEDIKTVNLKEDNYKKIFEGELEQNSKRRVQPNLVLNYLFEVFNIHHPNEFKGRSLSVSDIVKVNNQYYHCQSVGWKEVEVI